MQTQIPASMPESANFARQVELNRSIEGVYPLSKFPRLGEMLASREGEVKAKLEFGYSVGYACFRAQLSARLLVECQRCLQPMPIDIEGRFKFALVHDEDEFELLPEEFEPYLLEGEEQSILDLIEDELLLSLPMVSMHDSACSDYMQQHEAAVAAEKEASHPFAALKALKSERNDED